MMLQNKKGSETEWICAWVPYTNSVCVCVCVCVCVRERERERETEKHHHRKYQNKEMKMYICMKCA